MVPLKPTLPLNLTYIKIKFQKRPQALLIAEATLDVVVCSCSFSKLPPGTWGTETQGTLEAAGPDYEHLRPLTSLGPLHPGQGSRGPWALYKRIRGQTRGGRSHDARRVQHGGVSQHASRRRRQSLLLREEGNRGSEELSDLPGSQGGWGELALASGAASPHLGPLRTLVCCFSDAGMLEKSRKTAVETHSEACVGRRAKHPGRPRRQAVRIPRSKRRLRANREWPQAAAQVCPSSPAVAKYCVMFHGKF